MFSKMLASVQARRCLWKKVPGRSFRFSIRAGWTMKYAVNSLKQYEHSQNGAQTRQASPFVVVVRLH